MARQTGCSSETRFKPKTTKTTKATRGIMPESYEGTVRIGPARRIFDRLVG